MSRADRIRGSSTDASSIVVSTGTTRGIRRHELAKIARKLSLSTAVTDWIR